MSRSTHLRAASVTIDLAAILAALSCAGIWSSRAGQGPLAIALDVALHFGLFGVVWVLVATRLGTYQIPVHRNRRQALRSVVEAWATTWGVAGLLAVSVLAHPDLSVWAALGAGFVTLGLARLLLAHSPLAQGHGRPRTLVVGACSSARSLTSSKDAQRQMDLVGFVPFAGEDPADMPHLEHLGSIEQFDQALAEHRIDLAMVCPSDRAVTGEVHRVFHLCDEAGLSIQYFPSFLDLQHLHVGMSWNESQPGLTLHTLPNQSFAQLAKRAIDVVGASMGLLALLPVFAGCALAVKLTSSGPVFFRQTRVGKNGEPFTCLKFRTMKVGAHKQQELLRSASVQDGPAFKIPDDPRITPIGRLLRKFSLDELPQLLNVLLGDMSIVGPRPPIPSEVAQYTWWQRRRISVKPGLTCLWQVWGRNRVSFKRWVEMDLYYIDNWSLWMDLKLIAHTFRAVLSGTGM
jgi:exopolysaccharide biosynthesis polyprenyl glycosylphosphotransferase